MVKVGIKQGKGGKSPADLLVEIGPTIKVDIGLKSRADAGVTPDLAKKGILALIDTGASGDCIDNELAIALRLPTVDEGVIINGVGGAHEANVYMARVYVPALNKLLFQRFTGVKLSEGEQMHRAILGRAFLRNYRLVYDGSSGEADLEPSPPDVESKN